MQQSNQHIRVTSPSPFATPVFAQTKSGESVRITHVGDAEGMSPVYLCIDKSGRSAWLRQSDVTIADPNYLPGDPKQALRSLAQQ